MSQKPEQRMWCRLSKALEPVALCQRIEDRLSPDIPDVSFVRKSDGVSGWIELKTIKNWGRRPLTRIGHLRPGQVNWLTSRASHGASVWLLLWVEESDEWVWVYGADVTHEMADIGLSKVRWLGLNRQPFAFAHTKQGPILASAGVPGCHSSLL